MKPKHNSFVKISIPDTSNIILRERLFSDLDKARKYHPIIWVSSPAGSGKTSLISNYLEIRNISSLWYQIDERDSDIATFFYYMGLAAKKAAPQYKKALPLLTPEYLAGIKSFALRYFEQLYARLIPKENHRFTIVFDNYQDVADDSAFHDIINAGMDMLSENINIIFISRKEPPTQFSRLLANDKIHNIGWDKIKFNLHETSEFIKSRPETGFTIDSTLLYNVTDGWVAGLVLILNRGIDMTGRDIILRGHNREDIFNYFANEIFRKTGKRTQEFLLKTALLPEITIKTAKELTGINDSGEILSQLNNNNYFIQQQATDILSYRYHPLFREFLLSFAKEYFSKEELISIQQKAALLLERTGDLDGAIKLFLDARNWENATRLIVTHAQSVLTYGRSQTLVNWIENIPEKIREKEPGLLFWQGMGLLYRHPGKSRSLFERALGYFRKNEDPAGSFLAWVGIINTFACGFDEYKKIEPWLSVLARLLQHFGDFPTKEIEARVAFSMMKVLVTYKPAHPELDHWAERALELTDNHSEPSFRVQVLLHYMFKLMQNGNLIKAADFLDAVKSESGFKTIDPYTEIMTLWLEEIFLVLTGDHHNSLKVMHNALKISEITNIHMLDPLIIGYGVLSCLNAGDLASAEELIGRVHKTNQYTAGFYHFLHAYKALLLNDRVSAESHSAMAVTLTENSDSPLGVIFCFLIRSLVLDAQNDRQGTLDYLEKAFQKTKDIQAGPPEFLYHLFYAKYAFDQKKEKEGMVHLREGLSLGRKEGYAGLYIMVPAMMEPLLSKALESNIEVEYVYHLIKRYNLFPAKPPVEVEHWPYPLKIYTLGDFSIIKDGKPMDLSDKAQQKPLELLKMIIAMGCDGVLSEKITDVLWPESDGDAAYRVFITTLQRLRKLLGYQESILLHDGKVSLDPHYVWIDSLVFRELSQCLRSAIEDGDMDKANNLCQKALALYKGHFLAKEREYPWSVPLYERLKADFLFMIETKGACLENTGELDKAVEHYQNALAVDDFSEILYRHLMMVYQKLGRPVDAIKVYQRCEHILAKTLNIKPSPEMRSLYDTLLKASSK